MIYLDFINKCIISNWLTIRQGCRGYGNSHGDPHTHGNGMGMGIRFSPVGIPMGIPIGIPMGHFVVLVKLLFLLYAPKRNNKSSTSAPHFFFWQNTPDSCGFLMGIPTGFLWEWERKFHSHGNRAIRTV